MELIKEKRYGHETQYNTQYALLDDTWTWLPEGEVHRMELFRNSQQGGQYPEGEEGKGAPRGGRNWGVDSWSRCWGVSGSESSKALVAT